MNQFEMKQLAYQSQLKNRALQVLLYLIDRANKEQTCFPAVPTIGRELHISVSTVKRAMRELVEAGYVEKESRFRDENRGQTSNLYTLHFLKEEDVAKTIVSEELVQIEQAEQAGTESVFVTKKQTGSQSEDQDIDIAKSKRVSKITAKVNRSDTVSEDKHAVMEVINNCTDKRDCVKIGDLAVVGQDAIQGYENVENIEIVRSLLRQGRGLVITFFSGRGRGSI